MSRGRKSRGRKSRGRESRGRKSGHQHGQMSDERRAHGNELARHHAGHRSCGTVHDEVNASRLRLCGNQSRFHTHALARGGESRGHKSGHQHDQMSDERRAHGNELARHRASRRIGGPKHDDQSEGSLSQPRGTP